MFIETQDGDIINGDGIVLLRIFHQFEGEEGYAVVDTLTDGTSKTLFRGRQDACKQKLRQYTDTLNNKPLPKAIRQVYQELSGIRRCP